MADITRQVGREIQKGVNEAQEWKFLFLHVARVRFPTHTTYSLGVNLFFVLVGLNFTFVER